MTTEIYFWIGFVVFLALMLAIDLGIFHRKSHTVTFKESLGWTLVWIMLAMMFAAIVYFWKGSEKAIEFITGYVIELSLSVDNLFIFILVFSYFHVPQQYQHKILFWGILGALVMRVIFIFAGVALISKFHWIIYVFGAIIIISGIKMLFQKDKKIEPEKNPLIRFVKKMIPVTHEYHGDSFFIKLKNGAWAATPLFIVLVFIEITDLIFAIDSIPAILAITTDTFIVFTSNAFAILGLRSLYFALAGMLNLFRFLHIGLSLVLIFIGLKMVLSDIYKVPIEYALLIVLSILLTSISASLILKKKKVA
ncbi:MAG: TerC family protein [Bacteroidetes bacterium]|nr:TerC family protein [Bacteroidota bacterium]MBK8363639.1 TerC family protein [Bacteroidota bacterium]MBL0031276.1 TerC family protein [Bacteroidota bacterium]